MLHTGKQPKDDAPPKVKKKPTEKIDYRATATDNAVRNIDVILELRTSSKKNVAAWLIDHKACPAAFKEKCQSEEGKYHGAAIRSGVSFILYF